MSRPGLNGRVVRNGFIDGVEWSRAVTGRWVIGECQCGDALYAMPVRAWQVSRTDYIAQCVGCQSEVLAPGGKVLSGSASQSQRKKNN